MDTKAVHECEACQHGEDPGQRVPHQQMNRLEGTPYPERDKQFSYLMGLSVSDKATATLDIEGHTTCPQWNYTIYPRLPQPAA